MGTIAVNRWLVSTGFSWCSIWVQEYYILYWSISQQAYPWFVSGRPLQTAIHKDDSWRLRRLTLIMWTGLMLEDSTVLRICLLYFEVVYRSSNLWSHPVETWENAKEVFFMKVLMGRDAKKATDESFFSYNPAARTPLTMYNCGLVLSKLGKKHMLVLLI